MAPILNSLCKSMALTLILFGAKVNLQADLWLTQLVKTISESSPFAYNLQCSTRTAQNNNQRLLLCLHGSGSNSNFINRIPNDILAALLSFNFPDHDQEARDLAIENTQYGTLAELLPILYVLKTMVIDHQVSTLDLYGFSAGGGALINTLALLHSQRFKTELTKIGITHENRNAILKAITQGHILLDCPLKSIEEISDYRGNSPELAILAQRYRDNRFRPIDNLASLTGLPLQILLYFEEPDEILSNRDDQLFYKQLQAVNAQGKTTLITGNHEGHNSIHTTLWKRYKLLVSQLSPVS